MKKKSVSALLLPVIFLLVQFGIITGQSSTFFIPPILLLSVNAVWNLFF